MEERREHILSLMKKLDEVQSETDGLLYIQKTKQIKKEIEQTTELGKLLSLYADAANEENDLVRYAKCFLDCVKCYRCKCFQEQQLTIGELLEKERQEKEIQGIDFDLVAFEWKTIADIMEENNEKNIGE